MRRSLFIFLLGITTHMHAQNPAWKGKFEQLEQALPTPNTYRSGSGAPGANYWQQRADYVITAEVDDNTQVLKGNETITYYNNSPETLTYLWLQLDQNLFAEDNMTSETKTGAIQDSIPAKYFSYATGVPEGFAGGYKIFYVRDAAGKDLPYVINKTMMRVDLPVPLKTGDKFVFSIEWSFQ